MWIKGETFRSLDEAEAAARGTLDRAAQTSLFDRIDWFRRTLRFAAPEGHPLFIRARTEGSDCWLFLMQQHRDAVALASWYTLAFRPVFTGEPSNEAKNALLIACARRLRRRLDTLVLAPMPADDVHRVAKAFDRAHWIAICKSSSANWTVETTGEPFSTFWAERPGELRETVRRKQAKSGIVTSVQTGFDPAIWSAYEAIYASSWKPTEGSQGFLRDMAEAEPVRIGIATLDGIVVAAQLWTVENGRAIIHKLAHDEQAARFSPGTILTKAMFEHVIDVDQVNVIDFGTGDDAYKADWMDTRRSLYTLRLLNPSRLRGLWLAARASARNLVERSPGR